MKRLIIAVMAILLSLTSADVVAQSFLKSLGKAVAGEIKKSVRQEAEQTVNNLTDKAMDKIKKEVKEVAEKQPENSKQSKVQSHNQAPVEHYTPAQLPAKIQPAKVYKYDPKAPTEGKHFSRDWVDLGLPSGVRWATSNYSGSAYSWGAMCPEAEYNIQNYNYYGQDLGDISGKIEYDIARTQIGRGWRLPTIQDFMELMDNCDRVFTTEGSASGVKFTSRINGKSIFLPVEGYREGWNHYGQGEGYYWLSTPGSDVYTAFMYKFSSDNLNSVYFALRHLGCHIRMVMDRPEEDKRIVKGNVGGHDWVDMGLPSGTRWATCNIDAATPYQPGKHYAWGETAVKSSYTEANSKFHDKYDLEDIAGTANDVAHVKWGNGWKMPTREQIAELAFYTGFPEFEHHEGRTVVKLTSQFNGQVIYLPATGHIDGTSHENAKGCGNYWGSTPSDDAVGAYGYNFGSLNASMGGGMRYTGCAVRPVLDKASHLKSSVSGQHNGHDWVDLGLPSGTKWATCNVGAEYPDQNGKYYAWGEKYDMYETRARKNNLRSGTEIVITANPRYDTATANWGAGWQMPTIEQYEEIIEHCTWEWTSLEGRSGYKVTSKTNGNWVFFVTAGEVGDIHDLPVSVEEKGSYWATTAGGNDSRLFKFSNRDNGFTTYHGGPRFEGFSVRPVLSNRE